MMQKGIIVHNRPTLGEGECEAANRVIRSQWVAQGQEVEHFEAEFCEFMGLPNGHAVAVANGTAAIFVTLTVMGARGNKVAYPAYTCSAVRNAVCLSGAIEGVIDSGVNTPNLDVRALNYSKPNFAVVPHMYGIPVDFSKISDEIMIIEDCAQAIGAKINGEYVGLQGKAGVFSFYASKLITSGGQGGMVISKDKNFIDAIRDYRQFDQRNDQKRRFNFQMTDLQAAIGRVQLKKINQFVNRRLEIFERYKEAGLPLLLGERGSVRYRAIMLSNQVDDKIKLLQQKKIKTINPLKDWELLGKCENYPNAYSWTQKTISLPIYPSLRNDEIRRIILEVSNL